MSKTKYKVGDRICMDGVEGEVTDVIPERECCRVRLDTGRVCTTPWDNLTAAKKKDEKDEKPGLTVTRAAPEQTATHKMVEGPDRSGTRY